MENIEDILKTKTAGEIKEILVREASMIKEFPKMEFATLDPNYKGDCLQPFGGILKSEPGIQIYHHRDDVSARIVVMFPDGLYQFDQNLFSFDGTPRRRADILPDWDSKREPPSGYFTYGKIALRTIEYLQSITPMHD